MKDLHSDFDENSRLEMEASEWVARMDRGLSAEEQDQYFEWLAKDEAHRKALAVYQMDWEEYDRLAGIHLKSLASVDPDLLEADHWNMNRRPVVVRKILKFASLPIAALVILGFHLTLFTARDRFPNNVEPALELLTRIEQRELEDGSVIAINRGSVIEVTYTASERRVHLKTGEASFEVAKDPNRPFIVMAAGIDVKAVGTIFNVKLSTAKVDVIVKEGKVNVKVSAEASGHEESNAEAFLEIGHKATVQLDSSFRKVEVVRLDEAQLNEATYWQPRLLDYDSITLGELVKEFNRSNPIQVQFGDPSLESISLSSSFWSDNVEGFVRLMESSFGMKAEWRGSREIILNEKGV